MISVVSAIVSLLFFDLAGRPYAYEPGEEIRIEQNKLVVELKSPVNEVTAQVIDSLGRNVLVSTEVFGPLVTLHLKAPDRAGYVCGVMTVAVGDDVTNIIIRPHMAKTCVVHPR